MGERELVNIKVGTSSLTDEFGRLDRQKFERIADQVIDLQADFDVLLTSSAAISAGAAALSVDRRDYTEDLDGLSMLAAIGQPIKAAYWQAAFGRRVMISQHLATPRELTHDKRESAAFHRKLARTILEGHVADVNENDAIADDEIKVGDNDVISALVLAGLARLHIWKRLHLVNLTDVDGLFDGDPSQAGSSLIRVVDDISAIAHVGGSNGSHHGSGGAVTKIKAARIVVDAGQDMYIANSNTEDAVRKALAGEIGTHFMAAHVQ